MKITTFLLLFISLPIYSDTLTDSNNLFDWAESEYPELFNPIGLNTQKVSEWNYRHYPNTGNYLGVKSDDDVYVMGDSFGQLRHIDSLQSLLANVPTDPEACVNYQGLMWEVKTTNGLLRDKNNKYNWYDPSVAGSVIDTGEENCSIYCAQCTGGINCTTYHYVQEVNRRGLCGYHDWRMPNIDELESLVDTSNYPTINTDLFPNTFPSGYWSSTSSSTKGNAKGLYFRTGKIYGDPKWGDDRVRLVRDN